MFRNISPALIVIFVLMTFVSAGSANNTGVNTIMQGGDVFIGEEGLDISNCTGNVTQIAWFGLGSSPANNVPDYLLAIGDPTEFYVSPAIFGDRQGLWYQWQGSSPAGPVALNVLDPSIENAVISQDTFNIISFANVSQGDFVNFWVSSNMWTVTNRPGYNASINGPFTIKVKSPEGAVYTSLYQDSTHAIPLTGISFSSADATWVPLPPPMVGWNTGITDASGAKIYKTGSYEVTMECNLNNMKDNYKDPTGADYVGKTVSYPHPVNIISDTLAITANNISLVRGTQFSVTIIGQPSAVYLIWVKNTGQMTGLPQDQPPFLLPSQADLENDPMDGPYDYGGYQFEGGNGRTVREGIPASPANGTAYYGLMTLEDTGTWTIGWQTTQDTADQKYTVHVERGPPGPNGLPDIFSGITEYKSADVDIQVEKGTVTVVAAGDQSYFLGQEVLLSGTNSETEHVYLFITGPNLPSDGGLMTNPRQPVQTMVAPYNITTTDVNEDNTWEYKWQTANLNIDAGTYTIYAVATPSNKGQLADTQYGTIPVIIRKEFVTAQASQSTVAQGDSVHFRGLAEGQPSQGVAVWIMGKNYANRQTETVNDDGMFDYEVDGAVTSTLTSGQYFVVIQHPMHNDEFDATVQGDYVVGAYPTRWSQLFKLFGTGSLQGSDAANALTVELDNPAIDDTYMKLQFLVEVPEIKIVPIKEKNVGEKFDITGTTNLAVNDELLVEIYSSSFGPTPKETSGKFSGVSGTVKVVKGTEGFNTWSFPVDTSTFKPDEYIVHVSAIGLQGTQDVTATSHFNIDAYVPTTVLTTPPPTTAVTAVPTIPPTPVPTTAPGFGALVALIGLAAGAFLIFRKD
jgi:PGF-CTERM protein